MNIDQITRRVSDYEARENIHQQFLKEILILGEREALEFARFRADALADAIGFMIGRAVWEKPSKSPTTATASPVLIPDLMGLFWISSSNTTPWQMRLNPRFDGAFLNLQLQYKYVKDYLS